MRFEHLIEINAPASTVASVVPAFSRAQLWHGLMRRVQTPQRFPMGPERCDWRETEPGLYRREVHFGPHVLHDEVETTPMQRIRFTPEAHGDTTPVRLTITIEEPSTGRMVLRFVYEPVGEPSAEETYYAEYRHNAWLHNDRDMVRTLRQWLNEEGL